MEGKCLLAINPSEGKKQRLPAINPNWDKKTEDDLLAGATNASQGRIKGCDGGSCDSKKPLCPLPRGLLGGGSGRETKISFTYTGTAVSIPKPSEHNSYGWKRDLFWRGIEEIGAPCPVSLAIGAIHKDMGVVSPVSLLLLKFFHPESVSWSPSLIICCQGHWSRIYLSCLYSY